MIQQLSGAGGGGNRNGGGSPAPVPVEQSNSLRQEQKISLLYLIGEGECQGFPPGDARKYVFLDGVPAVNASGIVNYNLDIEWRAGHATQTVIPGFNVISQTRAVGTQMRHAVALEQQITDTDTDAFEVTVRVPTLQTAFDDGAIEGARVQWRVSLSSDGGAFVILQDVTVTEKSSGPFVKHTRYDLIGSAPWTVRVERLTVDSVSLRLQDSTFWDTLTEINYGTGSFDGVAVIGVRNVDAREFSSIPEVAIEWLGRRVKVPTNYNGTTRTYSGSFNGSLKTEWTDNPAWVLYDLLNDPIAACGLPAIDLDIYDYYELSQWADAQNPKLSININIATQEDAIEVLRTVASRVFSILMRRGSEVVPVIDNVSSIIKASFGDANTLSKDEQFVESGNFSYSTTKIGQRPAVANVTYQNPANFFDAIVERVIYQPAVDWHEQRGIVPPEIDITAFGCSNISEARQYGLYHLVTNFHQYRSVALETGPEGGRVSPGDNITVFDNVRQLDTKHGAGRLVAASRTSLQLDEPYTFDANKTYTVQVYNAGSNSISAIAVNNPVASATVLQCTTELDFDPVVGSPYSVSTVTLEPELFRVLEARESDSDLLTHSITAISQMPNKWAVVNDGAAAEPQDTVDLPNPFAIPPKPINFFGVTSPSLSYRSNGYLQKLDLLWHIEDPIGNVREFNLEQRTVDQPDSAWTPLAITTGAYYVWPALRPGNYEFRVQSVSLTGKRSPFTGTTVEVINNPPQPSNVSGFSYSVEGNQLVLNWQVVDDVDVVNAGNYLIKYLPAGEGTFNFNNGVFVGGAIPGNASSVRLPAKAGIYQIVARNSENRISATSASLEIFAASLPNELNLLLEYSDSDPESSQDPWDGDKVNSFLNTNDDLKLFWTADGFPNVSPTGTYASGFGTISFGRLSSVVLDIDRRTSIFNENVLWDSIPGQFDSSSEAVEGGLLDGANTYVEVRLSFDGTTYQPWQRLYSERVSLTFWSAEIRLVLESTEAGINTVTESMTFRVEADGPPLAEVTTTSGWATKTFASAFDSPPDVRLYALARTANIGLRNVTATGFEYSRTSIATGAFESGETIFFNVRGS